MPRAKHVLSDVEGTQKRQGSEILVILFLCELGVLAR